ncbi:unnamed protein product [Lactuca saligna]|uniref:Uncharacterized protein n=1 Tax=Lactuca saligna TaxID=75948 RepID=A0AA35ZFY0_LACSI|nr:unnamed protein product [Lactuca saligna]
MLGEDMKESSIPGLSLITPIKERIQVNGITNDEVKSHLHKYKLHIQILPPSTNTSSANQFGVVLEGLWMRSHDSYVESSNNGISNLCSPNTHVLSAPPPSPSSVTTVMTKIGKLLLKRSSLFEFFWENKYR